MRAFVLNPVDGDWELVIAIHSSEIRSAAEMRELMACFDRVFARSDMVLHWCGF